MPDRTTPTNTPKGHVVAQVEAQGQDASGKWVDGMNVTGVIDATGAAFTVFVPRAMYTPEYVAQALAEKAATVSAVHQLTFGG